MYVSHFCSQYLRLISQMRFFPSIGGVSLALFLGFALLTNWLSTQAAMATTPNTISAPEATSLATSLAASLAALGGNKVFLDDYYDSIQSRGEPSTAVINLSAGGTNNIVDAGVRIVTVATTSGSETPTPFVTITLTPTVTPFGNETPTVTPSGSETPTPFVTVTPFGSETPTPVVTITPSGSETPTPFVTVTSSGSETPTPFVIVTPSGSNTSTPPMTPTPVATATMTPMPVATATATATLPPSDATAVAGPSQRTILNYVGNGAAKLTVPTGAVNQPTSFLYKESSPPTSNQGNLQFAGRAFTLQAYQNNQLVSNFNFSKPVTLTLEYTDSQITGLNEGQLALRYFNQIAQKWQEDGITVLSREPAANRITLLISHLTQFALLQPPPADSAPTISTTLPITGATGVSLDANVVITFSEAISTTVNLLTNALDLTCDGGPVITTVTGNGTAVLTLNPDSDFTPSSDCVLTIAAIEIKDVDTEDPPDAMAEDVKVSFKTAPGETFTTLTNGDFSQGRTAWTRPDFISGVIVNPVVPGSCNPGEASVIGVAGDASVGQCIAVASQSDQWVLGGSMRRKEGDEVKIAAEFYPTGDCTGSVAHTVAITTASNIMAPYTKAFTYDSAANNSKSVRVSLNTHEAADGGFGGAADGCFDSITLTNDKKPTPTPTPAPTPVPTVIKVSQEANVNSARPGDTIVYTYRITNTSTVTVTVQATDDKLGTVALQPATLPGGGTATGQLTYVVRATDLLGPLVNTVTVSGALAPGTPQTAPIPLMVTATTTVTLSSASSTTKLYLPITID